MEMSNKQLDIQVKILATAIFPGSLCFSLELNKLQIEAVRELHSLNTTICQGPSMRQMFLSKAYTYFPSPPFSMPAQALSLGPN